MFTVVLQGTFMSNPSHLAIQQDIRTHAQGKQYPDVRSSIVMDQIQDGMRTFQREYLGKTFPWYLGGEVITHTRQQQLYETTDPATQSPVARFLRGETIKEAHVHALVYCAYVAGRRFAEETTPDDRMRLLVEISRVIEERFWVHCAAKAYECGQSLAEQIGETDEEVDFPLANASYATRLLSAEFGLSQTPDFAGNMNAWRYVPHGVFLDVSPFNFPGAIPIDMATKALVMGNAVIEKSSPKSSLNGYLVFDALRTAFMRVGIPWEGVLNFTPGGAQVVSMLLRSPYIAGVSFTGSSAVLGEIRATYGGKLRHGFSGTMAPLVFGSAETSGVNPFVVLDDANPAHAGEEYVKAFVGRSGQKCSSARVAFVPEHMAQSFLSSAMEALSSLSYGDVKHGAQVGPVASARDAQRLEEVVCDLVRLPGMKLAYVKAGCETNGYDFAPRILSGHLGKLSSESRVRIMNTEVFGPVSTVLTYVHEGDVQKMLALSRFALTGSVFTTNPSRSAKYLSLLPAGNVYLNRKCTGALVDSECFGGLRSQSSPSGIKGPGSLALFGSRQTCSGFASESIEEREAFIQAMQSKGWVFAKK